MKRLLSMLLPSMSFPHSSQRESATKVASSTTLAPSSGDSSSRAGSLLATRRAPRAQAISCVGPPQSVPHRFVLHRGAVGPGMVVEVILIVYEKRYIRIEGPLQAAVYRRPPILLVAIS